MALLVQGTLEVNQAGDILTLTDTTGVYNATTKPGGYGAPNRAVADNIVTELDLTHPDGTVVPTIVMDGTTLPTSDWIPRNALSRLLSITQAGWSGDEFDLGLIKATYRPFFTTPSAGLVSVLNGSPTVTAASGQNFITDLADTYIIRLADGNRYTVAPGGIAAGTLTLTEDYAGADDAASILYIGYEATMAAISDRSFQSCLMPKYIAARAGTCDPSVYATVVKLRTQWEAVYALFATPNYDAANELLIDIGKDCACLTAGYASGCSTCL